jgi:hypothetical protein
MVASLAWGFLAADLYRSIRHTEPMGFADFLFGQMTSMSPSYATSVIMLSAAVIVVLIAFGKEILYVSFDPEMARVSGVRAGLIHYHADAAGHADDRAGHPHRRQRADDRVAGACREQRRCCCASGCERCL